MAADTTHVFLNPTAGRGRAGRRRTRILELLATSDCPLELHESEAIGSLESQVMATVNEGASRIVVAGGDGSVHEAINGIMRAKKTAALGLVPTGTGNDFAKACDIPLNWEHATQLLAERLKASAPARLLDIGRCNERYFANGAGVGFDARVTRIAHSIRLPIGDLVYLLAIFRTMAGRIATPNLTISAESPTADSFRWDGPVTLAAISNGPWIGGMFHIAPMASNTDETLELLVAKPVTRRRILSLLPLLMKGEHLDEPDIVHQSVTSLTIRADEPLPSHLDGEVRPLASTFEISTVPGALSLL